MKQTASTLYTEGASNIFLTCGIDYGAHSNSVIKDSISLFRWDNFAIMDPIYNELEYSSKPTKCLDIYASSSSYVYFIF